MLINSEIFTFSILIQYQSHYKKHLFYSYPSFACNPPQPPPPQVPIFNGKLHPTELEAPTSNSPVPFFLFFLYHQQIWQQDEKPITTQQPNKQRNSKSKQISAKGAINPKGYRISGKPEKKKSKMNSESTQACTLQQIENWNKLATENYHKLRYLLLFRGGDKKTVCNTPPFRD